MKIDSAELRVRQGEIIDLVRRPTTSAPLCKSDKHYAARLQKHMEHPSESELQHDFLWRTTRDLLERGRIGIFHRSYYEEVLIVRVHRDILRGEGLPDGPDGVNGCDTHIWQGRYRSTVDLERHLHANGTRFVKFFLHLSKEEQRKRFIERIDDPQKNWKFSGADIRERTFWPGYMTAYEQCLSATSTSDSPWYVVPAGDKNNSRLIVSQIVLEDHRSLPRCVDPLTHAMSLPTCAERL